MRCRLKLACTSFFSLLTASLATGEQREKHGVEPVLVGVALIDLDTGNQGHNGKVKPDEGGNQTKEPADTGNERAGNRDDDEQGGEQGEVKGFFGLLLTERSPATVEEVNHGRGDATKNSAEVGEGCDVAVLTNR